MLKQQYELTADDLEEKDWRDMSDKEVLTRILMQSRIKSESLRKFRMKQLLRQQLMHRQDRRQMRLQAQHRVQQPMDSHLM